MIEKDVPCETNILMCRLCFQHQHKSTG